MDEETRKLAERLDALERRLEPVLKVSDMITAFMAGGRTAGKEEKQEEGSVVKSLEPPVVNKEDVPLQDTLNFTQAEKDAFRWWFDGDLRAFVESVRSRDICNICLTAKTHKCKDAQFGVRRCRSFRVDYTHLRSMLGDHIRCMACEHGAFGSDGIVCSKPRESYCRDARRSRWTTECRLCYMKGTGCCLPREDEDEIGRCKMFAPRVFRWQ